MNGAGCSMPRRSRAARRLPGISPDAPRDVPVLGCGIDPMPQAEVLRWCLETARSSSRARILLTANASHLVAMQDDPALREAAQAADLVTPDGMSLVWAGRLLGGAVPERVAGIDLLEELLAAAPAHGLRVFLLGATPAVMQRLLEHCRAAYPGLRDRRLAGRLLHAGPARGGGAAGGRVGADVLFLGMPSPFKDIWCERHRDALGVKLIMGVGGAFDVLAGQVPRAPRWMQASGPGMGLAAVAGARAPVAPLSGGEQPVPLAGDAGGSYRDPG